jgi:hypothetical protein
MSKRIARGRMSLVTPSAPVIPSPQQPSEPCCCGRSDWWLLPDGSAWRGALCHPAPGAHHAALALAGDRLALVRAAAHHTAKVPALGQPQRRAAA